MTGIHRAATHRSRERASGPKHVFRLPSEPGAKQPFPQSVSDFAAAARALAERLGAGRYVRAFKASSVTVHEGMTGRFRGTRGR